MSATDDWNADPFLDEDEPQHTNGHAKSNGHTNGHTADFRPPLRIRDFENRRNPPPAAEDFDLGEWDFGAENTDPTLIEPRGWLLGNWFCREFVSSLVGDGAAGKTALRIACAMALATGREDILGPGLHIFERVPVLYLCFEDGERELRRRLWAAMLHHHIANADIAGFLYASAITRHEIKLAVEGEFRQTKVGPLKDALERSIDRRQPGVVMLDPLVKTHGLDENSNTAMDLVIEILTNLSIRKKIALDVPQHTRKGLAEPGNADRGRGASAVKDAGRLMYTLCDMTPEEANKLELGNDDRLDLMRVDSAKVNIARRNTNATWFRRVGVRLGNTGVNPLYPHGDTVQTVERWFPPDTINGLSKNTLIEIFKQIRQGPEQDEFYLPDIRANEDWVGWPICLIANIAKGEAKTLVRDWLKNRVLLPSFYTSPKRKRGETGRVTLNEVMAAEMTK